MPKPKVKVYVSKSGKRYIKIGNKKFYLKSQKGMTERELIAYIIKRFTKKRKARAKKDGKPKGYIGDTKNSSTASGTTRDDISMLEFFFI